MVAITRSDTKQKKKRSMSFYVDKTMTSGANGILRYKNEDEMYIHFIHHIWILKDSGDSPDRHEAWNEVKLVFKKWIVVGRKRHEKFFKNAVDLRTQSIDDLREFCIECGLTDTQWAAVKREIRTLVAIA